jgi:hypothetical protein
MTPSDSHETRKNIVCRPHARWIYRDKAGAVFLFGSGEPASGVRFGSTQRCTNQVPLHHCALTPGKRG